MLRRPRGGKLASKARFPMTNTSTDPFARIKAVQREAWALFLPMEVHTTMPAAQLVKFAGVARGEKVLDVACGTGVVAITAARAGAKAAGVDLAPALVERARQNARTACVEVDFVEGDAEALPYPEASFDVVMSQFGHIFAPRPATVTAEVLRVLRPQGRIVFASWDSETFVGRFFGLVGRYAPPTPEGAPQPASPALWGDPNAIRERLGSRVRDLVFERELMAQPSLSPQHTRVLQEATIGPLAKLVASMANDPQRLAMFRAEYEELIGKYFDGNSVRQHFLMARATKA
jgi:SAM-dependent methyltransferase